MVGHCTGTDHRSSVAACTSAGTIGTAYTTTFTASGGGGTYAYTVSTGTQPTGLTLASATGILSGTPSATGTFNFTVRATDQFGCFGETAFSVTVSCGTVTLSPLRPSSR